MNYPEWAPRNLVELHRAKMEYKPLDSGFDPNDPESLIESIVRDQEGRLSLENVENLRQRLYRNSFVGLPAEESAEMLGRLITNKSMEPVWRAVEKHANDGLGQVKFFNACENAISGWRGETRRTKAERNKHLQRVQKMSSELSGLLHDCPEFDRFSITNMIANTQLEGILNALDADDDDVRYLHMVLGDTIPSIHKVLSEISERAKKAETEALMVMTPGSERAPAQFFIRYLHNYCMDQFSKPLHSIVAVTASTVFEDDAIDSRYVVGITKGW